MKIIRAKRVSNCYIQKKVCACVRLTLVLVGGRQTVYGQNTVYLCLSKYSPTGSRCTTRSIAKKSPIGSLPPAVPLAITRTFRPWTHTSDDSYIYQLSLVVATATVSFLSEVYDLFQYNGVYCLLFFICFFL